MKQLISEGELRKLREDLKWYQEANLRLFEKIKELEEEIRVLGNALDYLKESKGY